MRNPDVTPLFAEERREQILRLLEERSKILVPDLCEHFNVSPATIRGDLRDLEEGGKIRRTHGGAIPVGKTAFEPASELREIEHIEEKRRIGAAAVKLVDAGDTVLLDTGTTTLQLAKFLVNVENLTVVTTDLEIARFLERNSDITVILIGGVLRRGFHCAAGPMTAAALANLNVDKAFMAANAFSIEKGFTTPSFEHVEVKRAMMAISSKTVMLVDSSKIGRISFIKFADLADIDHLVTDSGVGKKALSMLAEADENIEVHIA